MEESQIKISVIVPVYNVEEYIEACLDSIVGQTYRNLEIILVDDGSTDCSGRICDEYAEKDDRIIVIHKENGGLVSARKAGVRLATGEYSSYVDSDDWIDKNAYEKLIKPLSLYHPDILAFGFVKEYSEFKVEKKEILSKGLYSKGDFFHEVEMHIMNNPFFCKAVEISVWSKLFKTHLLKTHQLKVDDRICMGEDLAVVFPSIFDVNSIYIENEVLYHYRVNKKSVCWNKREDEYNRYLNLIEYISKKRKYLKEWNDKLERYFIQIVYWYLILCATERCFIANSKCILFPELMRNDSIIIYGKGVFANNLIEAMNKIDFCNIITCIDRVDADKIRQIPEELYKYIVVAITDYSAVQSSTKVLEKLGIHMSKVLYIQKENLITEALPNEVLKII